MFWKEFIFSMFGNPQENQRLFWTECNNITCNNNAIFNLFLKIITNSNQCEIKFYIKLQILLNFITINCDYYEILIYGKKLQTLWNKIMYCNVHYMNLFVATATHYINIYNSIIHS